jgi:hypothetical protein
VLDLERTVKVAGITSHPNEARMMQMARNLTNAEEPSLRHTRSRSWIEIPAFGSLARGAHADRADPTAAAVTKFDCVCGEIRTLSEEGAWRADGLLQQIIA